MPPTYTDTCPNCGKPLTVIDVDGGHPPWKCEDCQRGWWGAELEARATWDPLVRSFTDPTVELNATTEQYAAELRGTSVNLDTIDRIPDESLERIIQNTRIGKGFRDHAVERRNDRARGKGRF